MRSAPDVPERSVRLYRGEYAAHAHDHAQVLVGLRGTLKLELDGHGSFVDASCALVIPAGTAHAYLAEAPASVLVVDCAPGRSTDRVRRFAPPPAWKHGPELPTAEGVLSALPEAPTLQPRRQLDVAMLTQAIDAQVHRDWTVAELAALCHFSAQRFRARFAELTGLSPGAYVRRRRLDAAERLLAAGVPLETAALQVGYAGASALCFALRRDRGRGARLLRTG